MWQADTDVTGGMDVCCENSSGGGTAAGVCGQTGFERQQLAGQHCNRE
jgi:hypothetical protein